MKAWWKTMNKTASANTVFLPDTPLNKLHILESVLVIQRAAHHDSEEARAAVKSGLEELRRWINGRLDSDDEVDELEALLEMAQRRIRNFRKEGM